MKKLLIISSILLVNLSFGQSKKDLQDEISRKDKTIDSLQKVIDNQENIIENRDRSNRILTEDVTELREKLLTEVDISKKHWATILKLRKQHATGTAKIMYMSNVKNVLKVPEGKYWVLNQFMADYTSALTKDSLGNTITEEVHVFLKEVNGTVLTDPAKNLYGPKLVSSLHPEYTIQFPIVFTTGVQFKIAVFKGKIGALSPYDGKVYCTYTEKDNN